MPSILAKTSIRDRLLTAIVGSDGVRVQSRDASFGYLSPLSLSGLRIESADQSSLIEVERIAAEHSWLGLLWARPQLGSFVFDRPSVEIRMDRRVDANFSNDVGRNLDFMKLPVLTAEVVDGSVVVRTSVSGEPPIDVKNIRLTLLLDRDQHQSVLRIKPATLFDHQQLSPQLCGHGLQLIAPLLADEIDAEGEFSLRIQEFQIPLGGTDDSNRSAIRIEGELELHQASVAIKNTIAKNVARVIIQLIGDSLPEKMMVAKGVNVRFQVINGRVHHQGLALLLPHGESSIEIVSSGSVGLDETLDLQVSIRLPPGMLGKTALANKLTSDPIVIAVRGTLDEPEIGLPSRVDWIQRIEGLISGEGDDPSGHALEDAVTDVLGGLLKRASERDVPVLKEPVLPKLLERFRSRREPEDR